MILSVIKRLATKADFVSDINFGRNLFSLLQRILDMIL